MVAKETAEESPEDATFFPYEGDESSDDESSQALVNAGEPDVLLEAPEVNIERISIETEQLRTGVSLFARIGNFVALEVGANAQLGNVSLKMRGVRAKGKVSVHLQKVYAIILRTLASIDRRPELAGSDKNLVPELRAAVGTETGEPAQALETAAAPDADKTGTAVEKIKGAIGTASEVTTDQVKKGMPSAEGAADKVKKAVPSVAGAADKVKKAVPSVAGAAEKVKKVVPSIEKTTDKVKQAAPSVEHAAGEVAKKAGQATGKLKEAVEGEERHDRTDRVLRPIKHAAHEVADKVRLAITMAKVAATTHKATRAPRRAVKASGHVTKRVLHPDVPGLKHK
ncbi:MAG: hypothetical protein HOV81_26565 [Kofleriaceae bacterium]|nr:hypothetical protein [Kofleriaceae bacterium]